MDDKKEEKKGFKLYASLQMLKYVVATLMVMIFIGGILSFIEKKNPDVVKHAEKNESSASIPEEHSDENQTAEKNEPQNAEHPGEPAKLNVEETEHAAAVIEPSKTEAKSDHGSANQHSNEGVRSGKPAGWAFVDAIIAPVEYELTKRFYGWRVNDIIKPTDNVENIQLGVLEVTRRTVEILTERIARTGSTQSFDRNLSKARSNFNYSPYKFWLPSAESEYLNGIKELNSYKKKLGTGEAFFYTRGDNLLYLFELYRSILGSCEENLAKMKEDDGSEVSFFKADEYFYYSQGVAIAMSEILKAIETDFETTIKNRNTMEALHHAIEVLEHAKHIHPVIILDSDYGSFFANHRANMAAPIGHAKFYIEVLIKALST